MPSSLQHVIDQVGQVVLGKQHQVRLALACLLSRGHLLIEDLPGVGKTTLAHVLAKSLGLDFHRVQFTSDMLPADIIGVSIYDRNLNVFEFHAGPIFAQLVLADEVNRATPKTQSALLEAMEEHQVTADGVTRALPEPFFVVATQNPSHQIGTFPLPESQLDRFQMRIELGYPDRDAERALLEGMERRDMIAGLAPCLNPIELIATVAEWHGDSLTIHEGTQHVNGIRQGLARELGIVPEKIRVLSPFAGGGFGQKNSLQAQTVLVAVAVRSIAINWQSLRSQPIDWQLSPAWIAANR